MNIQIDEFLNPRCILILYFTTWNQSNSHNMIVLINYYLSFYKVCYTPFSDCSFQPITFESRVRGIPMAHAYDSTQAKPCQWILGLLSHTGYDEVVGLCILLVRRKCRIVLFLSWYSLQFSNSSVVVKLKGKNKFCAIFPQKGCSLGILCIFFLTSSILSKVDSREFSFCFS